MFVIRPDVAPTSLISGAVFAEVTGEHVTGVCGRTARERADLAIVAPSPISEGVLVEVTGAHVTGVRGSTARERADLAIMASDCRA